MVIDQMKKQMSDGNSTCPLDPMEKQNSNGHFQVHRIIGSIGSIGSNGRAKVQWTIRDPFDKRNVQWPFDFSIGHLA
jgi:hypothetical protein